MLERLKKTLVGSYIGAITIAWVFSQAISHLASSFAAPVSHWLVRREYRGLMYPASMPSGSSLQHAVPELINTVLLSAVGYVLLRWLYFKPAKEVEAPVPE